MPGVQERSVIDEVSDPSELDQTGADDRQSRVEDSKTREYNRQREAERKEGKAKLDSALAEIAAFKQELAALKEEKKTPAVKEEIRDIEDRIADTRRNMRKHSDWPAWEAEIDERVKIQLSQYDYKYALDLCQDKAEEQSYDVDNFKKEINVLLEGKWLDKLPMQRVKLAFKEWKKNKDITERLKKADDEDKKRVEYRENGSQRIARKASLSDTMKDARETGDFSKVLSNVFDKPKQK